MDESAACTMLAEFIYFFSPKTSISAIGQSGRQRTLAACSPPVLPPGESLGAYAPITGITLETRYRPGGQRDDMLPVDGSSTVAKIAADLRPSADGSAVRSSLVAGGGYSQ